MNVLFLGAPGSGKGTQSKKIESKFNIPQISTGDLLRAETASGSEMGEDLKKIMSSGEFVSDDIVLKLVSKKITSNDCKNGFNLIFGNQNGDGTGSINADLQVKYTFKQCGFDPSEANYTGVNSATLNVQPLKTSLNGKKYRVKTRKLNTQCETISNEAIISVYTPSIVISPTSLSKREDADNASLEVSLTGTPSSEVYLDFVNIDNTEIAVSTSTLTFTPRWHAAFSASSTMSWGKN